MSESGASLLVTASMRALLFAALLTLAGCATIPLSTMARFSGFDEGDFVQIDARDVLVQVRVPTEFTLDPERIELSLATAEGESRVERDFPVTLLSQQQEEVPGGLFSANTPVNRLTFKLTDEGLRQFAAVQNAVLKGPAEPKGFNVKWTFSKIPEDAKSTRLWIDLQLSKRQGFFTLFDGAEIDFN